MTLMSERELYEEAAVLLDKDPLSKKDIKDLDRIIDLMLEISEFSPAGRGLAETVELIRMSPAS